MTIEIYGSGGARLVRSARARKAGAVSSEITEREALRRNVMNMQAGSRTAKRTWPCGGAIMLDSSTTIERPTINRRQMFMDST
jgi:hypothetical protein